MTRRVSLEQIDQDIASMNARLDQLQAENAELKESRKRVVALIVEQSKRINAVNRALMEASETNRALLLWAKDDHPS